MCRGIRGKTTQCKRFKEGNNDMKVLFAGGGTGGHINPAISVANYIKERDNDFEALFIGTQRGLETKLVPAAGYKIEYIDIKGFNRKQLYKNVEVVVKLIKANKRCRQIIKEFKPDAVVCTGGYVSGPVAMAAKKMGVGALIHEQNVYPGLTVKGAQKYVDYVAVSFEETVKHMKKSEKCVVTGNPIRGEILNADCKTAKRTLKIAEDKPFVLVFGGSLGADRINDAMIGVLESLAKEHKFSLMFGTGDRNYEKVMKSINDRAIVPDSDTQVLAYINNMHTAMAAADLVVARSGAITVSEIAALGKASILIPSPNVVRNHQEQNAREFEKANAAVVITEDMLTSDGLYKEIVNLTSDKNKLKAMSENVKKLAKTDALEKIYDLVVSLAAK